MVDYRVREQGNSFELYRPAAGAVPEEVMYSADTPRQLYGNIQIGIDAGTLKPGTADNITLNAAGMDGRDRDYLIEVLKNEATSAKNAAKYDAVVAAGKKDTLEGKIVEASKGASGFWKRVSRLFSR